MLDLKWRDLPSGTRARLIWAYPLPWLVAAALLEKRSDQDGRAPTSFVTSAGLGAVLLMEITSTCIYTQEQLVPF